MKAFFVFLSGWILCVQAQARSPHLPVCNEGQTRVEFRNRAHCLGPNMPLDGRNFSSGNLSRVNLSRSSMIGVNLSGANLSGAQLTAVNLSRADLTRANLAGANLKEARLDNAKLRGAIYTTQTVFPTGFDPKAQGMILESTAKHAPNDPRLRGQDRGERPTSSAPETEPRDRRDGPPRGRPQNDQNNSETSQ